MKKNLLIVILLSLLASRSKAQVAAAHIDSVFIKFHYTTLVDSSVQIDYEVWNGAYQKIYLAGNWVNGELRVSTNLFKADDTTYLFSIGHNDRSLELISKADLFLVEVPALKSWYSGTPIVVHNLSVLKSVELAFIKDQEYQKIKLECNNLKMVHAKAYQQGQTILRIDYY